MARTSHPSRPHSGSGHPQNRSGSSHPQHRSGSGHPQHHSGSGHSQHHTQHRRPSKKGQKRRRRRRILIIEIIILLLLIAGLFLWFKLGKIDWNDIGNIQINDLDEDTQELLEGYTTIAIFGVDNRSVGNYNSGNSDSIIICSINNETKEVKLMSVYRDTLLDTGNGNLQKCNAAYSHGGPQQALEMLNRNLDLNIQEYISVDFMAVVDAIDAVGGIEMSILDEEVPVLNEYLGEINTITGHDSPPVGPGYQLLNGVQAMAYCRIRYTQGDDFRRAERQRTVLTLLVNKAKEANLIELNNMVNAIFPKVSTSLSLPQCIGLVEHLSSYQIVNSTGWPMDQRTTTLDSKGSVDVPCTLSSNVIKAHDYLYDDITYLPTSTVNNISDTIVNLTGFHESDAVNYINWTDGAGVELREDLHMEADPAQ